jgi:hypothetical protein
MKLRYNPQALAAILALLVPVLYVLATGDFPGAHLFYGLQEDHWLVAVLLALR